MNYLKKTFSVPLGSDAYRKNWEKAFGKKKAKKKAKARLAHVIAR